MTHTPHDALFRSVFAEPHHAAELLRHTLGPDVARRIDWPSLRSEPGSFIDADLRHRQVDMLYSARFADHLARLYLLHEHQSGDHWAMALRLLGYKQRIWDQYCKDNPDARRLPAIFACVLHHSAAGWRTGTTFESLIDLPADAGDAAWSLVPRFRFALDDIGAAGVEALTTRAMSAFVRLTLHVLLEARGAADIAPLLDRWSDLLRASLGDRGGPGALAPIFRYLAEVRSRRDHRTIIDRAHQLFAHREDIMETIADMFRNEGLERGRNEGRIEGRIEGRNETLPILRRFLTQALQTRFGALPLAALARVEHADISTIVRWHELVATSRSLDELLAS